jgi:hypothetical protein
VQLDQPVAIADEPAIARRPSEARG